MHGRLPRRTIDVCRLRATETQPGCIELFLALNAAAGAVHAFPGAPAVRREWLNGSPFGDYVIPGVILLVAVGGSLALAAYRLAREPTAWSLSLIAGMVMVGWIAVETMIIGLVSWMQPAVLAAAIVIVWLALRLRPDSARRRNGGRDELDTGEMWNSNSLSPG